MLTEIIEKLEKLYDERRVLNIEIEATHSDIFKFLAVQFKIEANKDDDLVGMADEEDSQGSVAPEGDDDFVGSGSGDGLTLYESDDNATWHHIKNYQPKGDDDFAG